MRSTIALLALFCIAVQWDMAHMFYLNDPSCSPMRLQGCASQFQSISFVINGDRVRLRSHCVEVKSAIACVDNYVNQCHLAESAKQLADKFFSGYRKFFGDLCQEGSQLSEDYLKHSACMEMADHGLKTCMGDKAASFMSGLRQYSPDKQNALCCGAETYSRCMDQVYTAQCGPEAARLGKMAISSTVTPVLQYICGDPNFCSNSSTTSSQLSLDNLAVNEVPKCKDMDGCSGSTTSSSSSSVLVLDSMVVTNIPEWIFATSKPLYKLEPQTWYDRSHFLIHSIVVVTVALILVVVGALLRPTIRNHMERRKNFKFQELNNQ